MYSVIIPCRNGAGTLGRQLSALEAQSFDGPWEIVVADNGSTDLSREIVASYLERMPNLRIIDASRTAGINHARNRGVEESSGDFLLFCDCDDEVAPDWLSQMNNARQRGAVMVGGQLVDATTGEGIGSPGVSPLFGDFGYLLWPSGANCGFSRETYAAVGPFDENFRGGCDETDFFWRGQLAGMYLTGVSEARVRYFPRQGTRAIWRQSVTYGRTHVRLYRKYAAQAMPQARGIRSTARLLKKTVDVVRRPGDGGTRLALIREAGLTVGRVSQSARERTLYV